MGKGGATSIKETALDKALAQVSKAKWDRWKEKFLPVRDKYLDQLHMDAADEGIITGQINAGVGKTLSQEQTNVGRKMFEAGINPNSGRFKAMIGGFGIDRANIGGAAKARGAQAVDDTFIYNLANAINIGRGGEAETFNDMSTLSARATEEAINKAYRDVESSSELGSNLATAAGLGLAGWEKYNKPKEEDV